MQKLNKSISVLKLELKDWKAEYRSEKIYFKGEEKSKQAQNKFKLCKAYINDLQKAIEILNK